MEVFAKFDEPRGAVTPELLTGIYKTMGVDAPSTEELQSFIDSVYDERDSAEALRKTIPAVRGVPVGDGPEGARPRRCYLSPDELQTNFSVDNTRTAHQADVVNMFDIFANSAKKFPDNELYGTSSEPGKPYSFESYSSVMKNVVNVASGLAGEGLKRQQFVGVMLDTSPLWGTIQFALWHQVSFKKHKYLLKILFY